MGHRRQALGGDQRFALIVAVQLCVIGAPLGLWAAWGVVPGWGWKERAAVLASAIVHLLYFTTLLRGDRLADLTMVYPIARGTGPLLSATGAVLLVSPILVDWFGNLRVAFQLPVALRDPAGCSASEIAACASREPAALPPVWWRWRSERPLRLRPCEGRASVARCSTP